MFYIPTVEDYEKTLVEKFVSFTRELNQLKDKIDGEDVPTVSDSNV